MTLLDRITPLHCWRPEAYRPWIIDGQTLGNMRHEMARRLADFPAVFAVSNDAVVLQDRLIGFEPRSAAVAEVVQRLVETGDIRAWRDEAYAVLRLWGDSPALVLDRGAVPAFGVRAFGVHMNGFVETPDGLQLWVAKRATDRMVAPGKLDHLVAGGQSHGLSVRANLVKECIEEANIPPALAARAFPVGALSYRCEQPEGLRDDVLFCYDLAVPKDFVPENTDGEVACFSLWPLDDVVTRLKESDDFKFNVPAVIIHFLIRRGRLGPDDPDYHAIVEGLRLA